MLKLTYVVLFNEIDWISSGSCSMTLGGGAFKTRFRCSGSQIEISIMKSVWEHQCEWLLIYNHDDLSDLHIEINFSKKIIFLVDLSSKLASKKRLEEILKESGKENEFWKKIFIEFDFLIWMGSDMMIGIEKYLLGPL